MLVFDHFLSGDLLRVRDSEEALNGLLIWNRSLGAGDSFNRVFYSTNTEVTLSVLLPAIADNETELKEVLAANAEAGKHFDDLRGTGFFYHPGGGVRNKVDLLGRLPLGISGETVSQYIDKWFTYFPDCGSVELSMYADDLDMAVDVVQAVGEAMAHRDEGRSWGLHLFSRLQSGSQLDPVMEMLDREMMKIYWLLNPEVLNAYNAGNCGLVADFEDAGFLFQAIVKWEWEFLEDPSYLESFVTDLVNFHNAASSREIHLLPTIPANNQPAITWDRFKKVMELFLVKGWDAGFDPSLFSLFSRVLNSIIKEPLPFHMYELDLARGDIYPFADFNSSHVISTNDNPLSQLGTLNKAYQRSRVVEPCASCGVQTLCPGMSASPSAIHDHAFHSRRVPAYFETQCAFNKLMITQILTELLIMGEEASKVAPPLKLDITEDKKAVFSLLN